MENLNQESRSLLILGSEEGGTIRFRSLPGGKMEMRVTSMTSAPIHDNVMDRDTIAVIRNTLDSWLKETQK